MAERPILFSGPMVRAILDGSKTQTRRVLGVQPLEILTPADKRASSLAKVTRKWDGKRVWFALTVRGETVEGNRGVAFRCKHGEVGDRLWVRETFAVQKGHPARLDALIWYAADGRPLPGSIERWRPSIHMPRWASRITLEITDVRVERLRDITSADAVREGIAPTMRNEAPAVERYRDLWDSLNAKRGYGWDVNPWVWVLTFRAARPGTQEGTP